MLAKYKQQTNKAILSKLTKSNGLKLNQTKQTKMQIKIVTNLTLCATAVASGTNAASVSNRYFTDDNKPTVAAHVPTTR